MPFSYELLKKGVTLKQDLIVSRKSLLVSGGSLLLAACAGGFRGGARSSGVLPQERHALSTVVNSNGQVSFISIDATTVAVQDNTTGQMLVTWAFGPTSVNVVDPSGVTRVLDYSSWLNAASTLTSYTVGGDITLAPSSTNPYANTATGTRVGYSGALAQATYNCVDTTESWTLADRFTSESFTYTSGTSGGGTGGGGIPRPPKQSPINNPTPTPDPGHGRHTQTVHPMALSLRCQADRNNIIAASIVVGVTACTLETLIGILAFSGAMYALNGAIQTAKAAMPGFVCNLGHLLQPGALHLQHEFQALG